MLLLWKTSLPPRCAWRAWLLRMHLRWIERSGGVGEWRRRTCYIHPFLGPTGSRGDTGVASAEVQCSDLPKSEFSVSQECQCSELFFILLPQTGTPAGTGWCGLHLMWGWDRTECNLWWEFANKAAIIDMGLYMLWTIATSVMFLERMTRAILGWCCDSLLCVRNPSVAAQD